MPIPKGTQLSKRAIATFYLVVAFILITIVWMTFSYSSNDNTNQSTVDKPTSDFAARQILQNSNTDRPILPNGGMTAIIDGVNKAVYRQGDQLVIRTEAGGNIPLKNGDIVSRDGKLYRYLNGKLVPLTAEESQGIQGVSGPQVGDLVEKDGKFYVMGADGKLHPYTGNIPPGKIVWKDGKPYVMGADGKLHAIGDKPQVGDLMEKDGKYYQLGADGKWHEYKGKLQPGQVVWKDGKAYVVGADGQLHAVGSQPQVGDLVEKDGKLYEVGADGKLHPYNGKLQPGQIVWKDGKAYMVGADGKLHAVKNGDLHSINGKPYVWKNGKWVPLASQGAKPGDLVYKDGKYYRIGKDGKLHLYEGELKPGTVVWKDGVPYVVGADGKLNKLKPGQHIYGEDGSDRVVNDDQSLTDQSQGSESLESDHSNSSAAASDDDARRQRMDQILKSQIIVYEEKAAPITKEDASSNILVDGSDKMSQILADQAKARDSLIASSNEYAMQNGQAGKAAFLQASSGKKPTKIDSELQHPRSPYTMYAGSIIPATFITGINSDLPGEIIAQVRQNVFDSVTGNYLLIPQGTRIIGTYDAQVTYGQERVLMAWTRLVFPNGTSYDLDGMPGADLLGYTGIKDLVDNHNWRIWSSVLMFSLFGAAGQLTQPDNGGSSNSGPTTSQIIYSSIGQNVTQTAMERVKKDMNIQPTLKIRPGNNFNVLLTRDMVLPSPYPLGK